MSTKSVAVIGSGPVGEALSKGFLKYGYEVTRASRDPSKLSDWLKTAEPADKASTGTFAEASASCDLIVLAVGGAVAESALEQCGLENLRGKVVIDTCNPIGGPPDDGVLTFFAGTKDSLMEKLQEKVPEARFVKCFSCVGNAQMVDPDFGGIKPTMFICGNDEQAKKEVTSILDQFGWETADMGGVKCARAIEPLCQLWCIPLFQGKKGNYAFKLLQREE
jgi:predicted dinucleotide-binding enzyme